MSAAISRADRETLKIASEYACSRVVFGRPIGANQAIQFPLAALKMRIELTDIL